LTFDYYDFISKNYKLNRATVTDDISKFILQIKEIFPESNILKAKSGNQYLTWIIPQSWDVIKAQLKDSTGKIIVDYKNNPLHLIQYSSSFKGELKYDDLKTHLNYSKENPMDIPYIFRKQYDYNKDDSWGFCLPYNIFVNLKQNEKYYVDIDVKFSNKEMFVFDLLQQGKKEETIFFAAHSCHPGQVNDGIVNVALLIDLFLWIKSLKNTRYSYRLIIGPEYFAAPFVLSQANKIENLAYGFFLDMMAHDGQLGYSSSYDGDTLVDFVTSESLKKFLKSPQKYAYRELWGNDEMFYDGPDFNIPTIGLGRSNFKNYHLSSDDLSAFSKNEYEESLSLLKKIVLNFESNTIIKRNYAGPLYLSRYDYYIDPKIDLDGYKNLQKIQIALDGKQSTLDIAKNLNIDIEFINKFVNHLLKINLANEPYN
jgi:aminopeptidase-like protein